MKMMEKKVKVQLKKNSLINHEPRMVQCSKIATIFFPFLVRCGFDCSSSGMYTMFIAE